MMAKHAAPLDHGVRFQDAWRQTSMLVRIIASLGVVVVCLVVVILLTGTGARPHFADGVPTTGSNAPAGTGSTIVPPGLPALPTPSATPTGSTPTSSAPARPPTSYASIPGLPGVTDVSGRPIPVTLPPGVTVSTSVGSQPGAPTVIVISSGSTSTTITQPPPQPPPSTQPATSTATQPASQPPKSKPPKSHPTPTPTPPAPTSSSTPPLIPVGGVLCKLLGLCL